MLVRHYSENVASHEISKFSLEHLQLCNRLLPILKNFIFLFQKLRSELEFVQQNNGHKHTWIHGSLSRQET